MTKTLNALAALGALKGASHGPLCGAVVEAQLFTWLQIAHSTSDAGALLGSRDHRRIKGRLWQYCHEAVVE